MSSLPDDSRLHAAVRAVAAAVQVTRHVQHALSEVREIAKDDRSPVTVADFAAQAVVQHALETRLDEMPLIVGEESAGILRSEDQKPVRRRVVEAVRRAWDGADEIAVLNAIDACNHDASAEAYWTLDPVDGTKGFLRRGQYAISLGWIEHGRVIMGVIGCPNLSADFNRAFDDPDPVGSIYIAVRDGGAWCCPADSDRPTRFDPVPRRGDSSGPVRVCESVEAAHSSHDDTAQIVERLGGAGTPARLDSQCKYAVVARGQADAYLRMPTRPGYVEKIWDHAAGHLVAAECGVVVTDIEGKALDFSQGARLSSNRGLVCAIPEYHARIIEAIHELGLCAAS